MIDVKKCIKLLLSILVVCMLFFVFYIASSAFEVWDSTVSSEAPQQNARGYYLCKNGKDLAWISNRVNSGYTNLKIMLTEDIYLNDIERETYINEWTPIGNYDRKFEGYFEGNNHCIYGLYINSSDKYQGLFGFVSDAHINGVKLYESRISAKQYVGGICGYSAGDCEITNSVVSGSITCPEGDCGGITGYARFGVKISCCGNKAVINSGANRVAGIAGCAASNVIIEKCFNMADISSSGKFVGGICGTSSGSTVTSCYNSGNIYCSNRAGGIVGNNVGDVYVSYNCGNITSDKEMGAVCGFNSIAVVKNCYYLQGSCESLDQYAIEKTSAEMKRYSFIVSLNKNGGDFVIDYQEENNDFPVLSWQIELEIWTRGIKKPSMYLDGESYMITSAEELAWFAGLVNGTLDDTPQDQRAKAVLTKSIILNLGEYDEEASNIWTPIGSGGAEFLGRFDGNGKTVTGVIVKEGDYAGLFGNVRVGAEIKNIKIDHSTICGRYAGGVAGANFGTISAAQVSLSDISAQEIGGGIVGENDGVISGCSFSSSSVSSLEKCGGISGTNSGEIISSFNISPVTSSTYAGGITGQNTGTISSCFNSASVSAMGNYCAGIAAHSVSGTVAKCYNTGTVSGSSYVGGIVGFARYGEITVCYNVGEVSSSGSKGAVCAQSSSTSLSNLFYDSQRITATDANAVALNTSQMTGSTAVSHLSGFSRSEWSTKAESEFFCYYPQLNDIASSGNYDYYYDSLQSVTFLKYDLHCRVDINETITYYNNLKQACDYIDENTANIYIFEDMVFSEPAVVKGKVTVSAEGADLKLTRTAGYTGSLFDVRGELYLGTKNDEYVLTYDGKTTNSSLCESMVTVGFTGNFNLVNALIINNTSNNGAAVFNNGNSNLLGGEIKDCISYENGGAVFNCGEIVFNGTTVHNNMSFSGGGALYNVSNANTARIVSGKIYNNSSSNGGAVFCSSGTVSIEGAEIYQNSATRGGAIYVNGGNVNIIGGSIYSNNADNGSAAFNNSGNLNMGESGYIDQSNDVYLPTGKTVTMISKLNSSSVCLNITPEVYQKDIRVVDGTYGAMNYKRVMINDYQQQSWRINSSGRLLTDEVVEVVLVSILGAHSVYYTSLEEAFEDIGNNDAIITLVDDVTVSHTLNVMSNVTILSDSQQRTVTCSPELNGELFVIKENSSLVLGDNVNKEENDVIFIDASSYNSSNLIHVEENGRLFMYNGSVVCFMTSNENSAVLLDGEMNMFGGKFVDNSCLTGAVNISETGTLNFYGGIFDNEELSVYKTGTMRFYNNSSMPQQVIYLNEGTVELDDEYTCETDIAVLKLEKYTLGRKCVDTNLDTSVYKDKFNMFDDLYYLDDNMSICADKLQLKETAAILVNTEYNFVYGIDVDVNTAENIASQFVNSNVVIFDESDNEVSSNELCGTKYKVCLVDKQGEVYDYLYIIIYGDVNSDGFVDGEDSVYINMAYYGFFTIDDVYIALAADVNHDGIVDLSDAWMTEDAGIYENSILQNAEE